MPTPVAAAGLVCTAATGPAMVIEVANWRAHPGWLASPKE
jgi:hypothetical protein